MSKIKIDLPPISKEEAQRVMGMGGYFDRPKKSGCLAMLLIPVMIAMMVMLQH